MWTRMNSAEEIFDQLKMEPPIVQCLNFLLEHAVEAGASDLHFEPFEKECKVRCRIDGMLRELKPLSRSLAAPLISRIKLLADLDITETRLPQDGRFHHVTQHGEVDFRVATLPTPWGESLVLRVLDRRRIFLSLAALELPSSIHQGISSFLAQPHGLFIVTGPTGSGKTTTLYACLQELNARGLKLLSAEDPIEYDIEGVMQIAVHEESGLSFERILRGSLRHDPDGIMVGETRDSITAKTALQASLTGHLVLTTLHTSDTVGAIVRLLDMGIDPLMIATTLSGVLTQRLVRKICTACRTSYQPEANLLAALGIDTQQASVLFRGRGCAHCHGTGYRGRVLIAELLSMHDQLRLLITQHASHDQLHKKATTLGMKSLREHGIELLLKGITTVEEIISSTTCNL